MKDITCEWSKSDTFTPSPPHNPPSPTKGNQLPLRSQADLQLMVGREVNQVREQKIGPGLPAYSVETKEKSHGQLYTNGPQISECGGPT